MFAQASDFAVWYWCLLPKMAYRCLLECTTRISLEMATAAYRQIAEVQRLRAIAQYEQEKHDRLLEKNTKLVQEYRELRESECRRLHEEAERLQKHERLLDLKEKSANDWAECYLKGSAASAHAKMMNATSVSHASRAVDSDMQRMCLCRSCGGWIIFPKSSCPAGQPTEKPYEGHDTYGVEPSHSSAGPAET